MFEADKQGYNSYILGGSNLPLKIIHCEKDWNLRDEFDEPTSIYDENRSSLITLFSQ